MNVRSNDLSTGDAATTPPPVAAEVFGSPSSAERSPGAGVADLVTCDREPIHLPGRIQPHGILIALDEPELRITHVTTNVGIAFARAGKPESLLGQKPDAIFGVEAWQGLRARLMGADLANEPLYLSTLPCDDGELRYAVAHRFAGRIILELEPAAGQDAFTFQRLHGLVRQAVGRLQAAATTADVCRGVADEVRAITGFSQVMIYQFDGEWNGKVVAESKDESRQSYLHHHFPASDIPRQARELYRSNRVRLIADVRYTPVDVVGVGADAAAIDLSHSTLRSVSPIHIEYLQNMGVGASMSVSILRDGELWGLIACHHSSPRFVPFDTRVACDHLAQIAAIQLAAREFADESDYRISLTATQNRLLGSMSAQENYVRGLVDRPDDLLGLTDAGGAAVLLDDTLHLIGRTPDRPVVDALLDWLAERGEQEMFHTDRLSAMYPPGEALREVASGLLAVPIQGFRISCLLWFRPEVVQTITWAGNPEKRVEEHRGGVPTPQGPMRVHPRKSFDAWKQVVRSRSLPWRRTEIQAATGLREAIVGIVLRKAEELARLNAELQRSNRELEAFSYSVSHDLRAPFRHIVGFASLLKKRETDRLDDTSLRYINTIAESARYAGTLVDSLLSFSHMGRKSLTRVPVDLNRLTHEVRDDVTASEGQGRQIEWDIGEMPTVEGDGHMLRLALRNLLSNAVKYTRVRPVARIEISCQREPSEFVIRVRDNGAGFDPAYSDKLFGVFQRLHRVDEFEGTGIGLANVRRIVERHGGRTWAEGVRDGGATFFFSLPRPNTEPQCDDDESTR